MTDKQKIIDGVDVSGCIFHSLTTMGYVGYNYCKCFECVCKCHNDCYYKQLNRKEEECEQLKQTLIEIKPVLELYANSKIGEEQLDRPYKIIVEDSKVLGGMYIAFDPRPAKQALQKISEVLKNE